MERRLGRGLGSLLAKPAPDAPSSELPLDSIRANPFQPRRVFDETGLEELRASIAKHGVLHPIVVRHAAEPDGPVRYELVSGERRLRASRLAGRDSIPAVVRSDLGDEDMLELALVENLQRRDLNPIERAQGFQRMVRSLDLTQEQVAERVGLRRSTVTNHLRLLELPAPVQEAMETGKLSMGHARALLGLPDPGAQQELMRRILVEDLSVRATEGLVREASSAGRPGTSSGGVVTPASPRAKPGPRAPWELELEARLRQSLGTKVRLENGPEYRGQIVVEYYDRAGLDRLLAQLAPKTTL